MEGGSTRPAGSIVLIDTGDLTPRSTDVFAVDIAGQPQLRRLVTRLDLTIELVHVAPGWPSETVASLSEAAILGREIALFRPA